MLLLERMDVHRWSAHSGPNPTQQRPARIPSGLPELYRVPNNWVVESLSCPRHSSYTSSRSPPKRCGHCINTVRAHEHGPALASSKANFVELRHRELLRIPLLGTSVNSPAPSPVRALALRFPAARGLALQACRDALCQLARTALLPRSRGSALCSG